MIVGTEWLVDATGCNADALRDLNTLRRVFESIIAELDLQVVGAPVWHQFPSPAGITGLALLTESHLACHTYPEFQTATFNLYCCRDRPEWPWSERLAEILEAQSVTVRVTHRFAADQPQIQPNTSVRPEQSSTSLAGGEW